MKKILFLILLISHFTLILSCSETATESGDNDLFGSWLGVQVIENYDGEEEVYTYDPQDDDYYAAGILTINQNNIIFFGNLSGTQYMPITYNYQLLPNNYLEISLSFGDETYADTIQYSFENGMLVFYNEEVYESDYFTEYYTYKTYYEKYTGSIPPASWTSELQDDSYEEDNSINDATQLSVNDSFQKHTLTLGDQDWFKFEAQSGVTYLLVVKSYMDNVLSLFDASGNELAYDDDNDSEISVDGLEIESAILWTCSASGTYYAQVAAWDEEYDSGYYNFKVMVSTTAKTPATLGKKTEKSKVQIGNPFFGIKFSEQ